MPDNGRQKEAECDSRAGELQSFAIRLEALVEELEALRLDLEFYLRAEQRHRLN